MSDDWAKQYLEEDNRRREAKQRRDEEAQKRQECAEAGANGKFDQIRERVVQDMQTLSHAVPFQSVEVGSSGREFTVISRGAPRVVLRVRLNGSMVSCEYLLSPKEGSNERDKPLSKTLRICSDLEGHITVQESGSGKAFAYDSDVSEFLLRPMLDHITAH
jgi:hypothetical protein